MAVARRTARDAPGRVGLAGRGLVVLLIVALLLTVAYLVRSGTIAGPPHVTALVADAGGSLSEGSDVKMQGVILGTVTDLARADGGRVRVEIALGSADMDRIPANVVARILPATVFGTSFVDLVVHGEPASRSLTAGSVIPADRTQGTVELQQALNDINQLVEALDPARLASVLGAAAQALDGRGEQIGRMLERLNRYLGKVNPTMPLVRRTLRKLATNLEIVQDVAPDLLQALEDGLVTASTIVEQRADLTRLLTGGTRLARTTTGFLAENQHEFVRYIEEASTLLDVVYDNRHQGITGSIKANIELGRTLPSAVERGYLHLTGYLATDVLPYYGPEDRPSYGSLRRLAGGDGG